MFLCNDFAFAFLVLMTVNISLANSGPNKLGSTENANPIQIPQSPPSVPKKVMGSIKGECSR